MFLDGEAVASTAAGKGTYAGMLNTDFGLAIGKPFVDSSASFVDGDISEILVYGGALSASDRQAVEQYLTQKYLPELIPGDANRDGFVDDTDASALADNWQVSGAEVTWGMGDFNGDLVVNDVDAGIMAANWSPPLLASVPEPSLLALLVTGGLALVTWRSYRRNGDFGCPLA